MVQICRTCQGLKETDLQVHLSFYYDFYHLLPFYEDWQGN